MEKIKVSFDFDGTMDRTDVQKYAKELIRRKIEVWICSARLSNEQDPSKEWNNDLYKIVNISNTDEDSRLLNQIAKNDGLSVDDFKDWFKDRQFIGVIINLTNFRY